MNEKMELVNDDLQISNLIYNIRGKQVMMDSDLARLYQVETKNLNKAMKRNQKRFPEEFCQKVFYDGQIFDAFYLIAELVARANESIVLVDGYVDVATLNILAKKKEQVAVTVYTYPGARITDLDVDKFNAQYPLLDVKYSTAFHDRFLILDKTEGYHIGASIKDAGKKCFGINQMKDPHIIEDILERLDLEIIDDKRQCGA